MYITLHEDDDDDDDDILNNFLHEKDKGGAGYQTDGVAVTSHIISAN